MSEGKRGLIKDHMARDDNTPRGDIKAAIAFVRGGVAKKDTGCRMGSQLVLCGGDEVGIAKTTKDTKVIKVGVGTIEDAIGRAAMDSRRWPTVEKIGAGGERLSPIG